MNSKTYRIFINKFNSILSFIEKNQRIKKKENILLKLNL